MSKLTDLDRTRLRWRARRGLLENDLIITRFLDEHETTLTDLDEGALDKPEVKSVLTQLRAA
jgi:antitoxin CptB